MTEIKEDLNILQFATQYDVKHSTSILESIKYLMYDEKSSKTALIFLNQQLANAPTRDLGFDILLKLLPDFSTSILETNAKSWATYAVSKHQHEPIAACRFQFLCKLYEHCHKHQDFYKTIVTNLLPKIIDTCVWVHTKSAEAVHSLRCLYYTMKYFPSACIVHKRKIEEYVMQFLDLSSKIAVTSEAAKCFHILNQIGGAGPNGSIHIKNYEDNFAKLYNTLNGLYDAMFENINEFRESLQTDESPNVVAFKPIPTYLSTMDVYKILNRRMANVVVFLIEMLQTDYNVKKTIKPEILEVIQRGLDIHVHGDENDPNRVLFNQCIQDHQIKLLFLLKALIQSLQHNFMRHLTMKMLVRYLTRVSDCTCYKVNSLYKSTIYNVIKYWLERSGEQIDCKTYEKLMELIIKDITPNKTTIALQMNLNNDAKGKNKTKEHQYVNEEDTPRVIQTNIENCLGALQLLETLLKSIHLNVKKATCMQLFFVITRSALDICVNTFVHPYTSKACRLQLFKVLIAIFDQQTYTVDIDLAVNIFSLGQRNDDIELSLLCQSGLKAMEKIVHPIQPTMQIPQEESSTSRDKPAEEQANASSVTVLSNLLIQSRNEATVQDDLPSTSSMETDIVEQSPAISNVQEVDDASTCETLSTVSKNDEVVDGNAAVVEIISDNEVEAGGDGNEIDADVSILDQDGYPIPTKKRKANDDNIIFTFDISEDPMESFVDEVK